jgi:hypothetical protein
VSKIDLTNDLKNWNVQLEREALNNLGAVVEEFNKTPSPTNARGGIGPGAAPMSTAWQSPKYGEDLINLAPKHRFLFLVKFHFTPAYKEISGRDVFSFLIKNVDKPKVTYEYQPVNMYNFRTQVLTNIKHEQLNMTFHDDIGNHVLDFFNSYRRAYSPISRYDEAPPNSKSYETAGMDFKYEDATTHVGGEYAASRGALLKGEINVLAKIELEQIYAHGTRKNIFTFVHPRIEQFDFDNVDHSESNCNEMTVSFTYDALLLKADLPLEGPEEAQYGKHSILGEAPLSQYPGLQTTTGAKDPQIEEKMKAAGFLNGVFTDAQSTLANAIRGSTKDTLKGNVVNSAQSFLQLQARKTLYSVSKDVQQSVAGVTGSADHGPEVK